MRQDFGDDRAARRVGLGRGCDLQRGREVDGFWNAGVGADQVFDLTRNRDFRAGLYVAGDGDLEWQDDLVLVAIVHEGRERDGVRDREAEVAEGDARCFGPGGARRQAAVARISPVDMPLVREVELECAEEAVARRGGGAFEDDGDIGVRAAGSRLRRGCTGQRGDGQRKRRHCSGRP